MRLKLTFLLFVLLFLLCGFACAESREITKDCRFTATVKSDDARRVTNDDYNNYWNSVGGVMTVKLPAGTAARGIQLSFLGTAMPVTVEALDGDGIVTGQAVYEDRYLNAYLPLSAEGAYRIAAMDPGVELRLNRVRVFSGDEMPPDVQIWREPEGPVDLLHIVTHPDDELVWFGGLLPTYAGERGMNVLVAYAVTHGALKAGRLNELLDGLWVCGVRSYPILGPFDDFQVKSIAAVIKRWGEGAAQAWCTGLLRQYQPKVVVTHDIRGESGHMQHQTVALAVIDAVTEWSGDAGRDPESAAEYGVFTPQKLYIHRYRQNEICLDWNQPLAAFGGKSGAEVARQAFKKHVSQKNTHYTIFMSGPMDSRCLGLYFSTVGEDVQKNDIFENIWWEWHSSNLSPPKITNSCLRQELFYCII